jgi:hypothetical protein
MINDAAADRRRSRRATEQARRAAHTCAPGRPGPVGAAKCGPGRMAPMWGDADAMRGPPYSDGMAGGEPGQSRRRAAGSAQNSRRDTGRGLAYWSGSGPYGVSVAFRPSVSGFIGSRSIPLSVSDREYKSISLCGIESNRIESKGDVSVCTEMVKGYDRKR